VAQRPLNRVPEQHYVHELLAEVGAAWRGGNSSTSARRRRTTGTAAEAAAAIAFKLKSKDPVVG